MNSTIMTLIAIHDMKIKWHDMGISFRAVGLYDMHVSDFVIFSLTKYVAIFHFFPK